MGNALNEIAVVAGEQQSFAAHVQAADMPHPVQPFRQQSQKGRKILLGNRRTDPAPGFMNRQIQDRIANGEQFPVHRDPVAGQDADSLFRDGRAVYRDTPGFDHPFGTSTGRPPAAGDILLQPDGSVPDHRTASNSEREISSRTWS